MNGLSVEDLFYFLCMYIFSFSLSIFFFNFFIGSTLTTSSYKSKNVRSKQQGGILDTSGCLNSGPDTRRAGAISISKLRERSGRNVTTGDRGGNGFCLSKVLARVIEAAMPVEELRAWRVRVSRRERRTCYGSLSRFENEIGTKSRTHASNVPFSRFLFPLPSFLREPFFSICTSSRFSCRALSHRRHHRAAAKSRGIRISNETRRTRATCARSRALRRMQILDERRPV